MELDKIIAACEHEAAVAHGAFPDEYNLICRIAELFDLVAELLRNGGGCRCHGAMTPEMRAGYGYCPDCSGTGISPRVADLLRSAGVME